MPWSPATGSSAKAALQHRQMQSEARKLRAGDGVRRRVASRSTSECSGPRPPVDAPRQAVFNRLFKIENRVAIIIAGFSDDGQERRYSNLWQKASGSKKPGSSRWRDL